MYKIHKPSRYQYIYIYIYIGKNNRRYSLLLKEIDVYDSRTMDTNCLGLII